MRRIVFLGSDPIALPLLEEMRQGFPGEVEVSGIITQPDRRSGRGMEWHPNPIAEWAAENRVPVLKPARDLDHAVTEWLEGRAPDLLVVMAYGRILRENLLGFAPGGCVNFHASLLPAYRGASPLETALACGETVSGVSLMRVVRALDAGPVCDRESFPITPSDTAPDLHLKAAAACVPLLRRNLAALLDGTASFTEQNPADVSYCRLLARDDAQLDFTLKASELEHRVRGLQPWPGASFTFAGQVIKVGSAHASHEFLPANPGTILSLCPQGLAVATGDGVLILGTLQRPGGKMLPAKDFLLGLPIPAGTVLPSIPAFPLVHKTHFRRPQPAK